MATNTCALQNTKEIYEEQTGNTLEKDVDLLDFFPDMGEQAQEILDFTYSYKMDK